MKDFIEKLKKHGYEFDRWNDGSGWTLMGANKCIPNTDKDNPHLAFWCLDEIERLGWRWVWTNQQCDSGEAYGLNIISPARVHAHHVSGKTKTEACMNALVAVLDAK